MVFLKELLERSKHCNISSEADKYLPQTEGVDDIVDTGRSDYVTLPKSSGKKKKKTFPTTDSAENSLINTLWYYQNADAS